uniref:Uncharacterized protein n=1 Tax=uncultured marine virus TaxID=186617 RepID=A0A0F7L4D6_9VIRU|nr:hypothetical protein [uncultured marine virus]
MVSLFFLGLISSLTPPVFFFGVFPVSEANMSKANPALFVASFDAVATPFCILPSIAVGATNPVNLLTVSTNLTLPAKFLGAFIPSISAIAIASSTISCVSPAAFPASLLTNCSPLMSMFLTSSMFLFIPSFFNKSETEPIDLANLKLFSINSSSNSCSNELLMSSTTESSWFLRSALPFASFRSPAILILKLSTLPKVLGLFRFEYISSIIS